MGNRSGTLTSLIREEPSIHPSIECPYEGSAQETSGCGRTRKDIRKDGHDRGYNPIIIVNQDAERTQQINNRHKRY